MEYDIDGYDAPTDKKSVNRIVVTKEGQMYFTASDAVPTGDSEYAIQQVAQKAIGR